MIKTLPTMKHLILQSVMLSPSEILDISFTKREITAQNEDWFMVDNNTIHRPKFTCVKKSEATRQSDILLGKVYIKHGTHHITGEPVITINRYAPDFHEDQELFGEYYDLSYYDVVTQEMQSHEAFKHLAVDSNGDLVSRTKWEADQ